MNYIGHDKKRKNCFEPRHYENAEISVTKTLQIQI